MIGLGSRCALMFFRATDWIAPPAPRPRPPAPGREEADSDIFGAYRSDSVPDHSQPRSGGYEMACVSERARQHELAACGAAGRLGESLQRSGHVRLRELGAVFEGVHKRYTPAGEIAAAERLHEESLRDILLRPTDEEGGLFGDEEDSAAPAPSVSRVAIR